MMRISLGTPARWFVVLTILLVLPLALPGNPPLLDYVNHLARMKIAFEPDEWTQRYYQFQWILLGDLGFEGVMRALTLVFPVEIAGKVAVALTVVFMAGALATLSLVVNRRITVPAVFGLVFVWSHVLEMGFMSFTIGVGLALFGLAAWIGTEGRNLALRLLMGAAFCLVIYLCHALAFLAYGTLIFGYMAGRLFWKRDEALAWRFGQALLAGLQALPVFLLVGLSVHEGALRIESFTPPLTKALNILKETYEANYALVGFVALCSATLAIVVLRRTRRLAAVPMIGPLLALFVLYLVLPDTTYQGTAQAAVIDVRMLFPLALAVAAAMPDPFPAERNRLATALAGAVVLVTLATIVIVAWIPSTRREAVLRACLGTVGRGQSIAAVAPPFVPETESGLYRPPSLMHGGAWAVIDRSAFYPLLFAAKFQQPLSYAAPYDALANRTPKIFYGDATKIDLDAFRQYDFLLMVFPTRDHDVPPQIASLGLHSDCSGSDFTLFSVDKTGSQQATPGQ